MCKYITEHSMRSGGGVCKVFLLMVRSDSERSGRGLKCLFCG